MTVDNFHLLKQVKLNYSECIKNTKQQIVKEKLMI